MVRKVRITTWLGWLVYNVFRWGAIGAALALISIKSGQPIIGVGIILITIAVLSTFIVQRLQMIKRAQQRTR